MPLEHYLYAGRDKFKIVDAKRNFIGQGYATFNLDIYFKAQSNGGPGTKMPEKHCDAGKTKNAKPLVCLLSNVWALVGWLAASVASEAFLLVVVVD